MTRLVLAVIAASFTFAASAQVYKWRDESGRVQYSDHPPAKVKAERLRRSGASAQGSNGGGEAAAKSAPAQKSTADLTQESRKRQAEADEKRKKDEASEKNAKIKEENCRRARQHLASLDSGVRQVRVDEKGERQFLDEAQIEREKAEARKDVDQWCK